MSDFQRVSTGLAMFEAALQPGAVLASVMFVNNKTGVIQDIAAIGAPRRARGIRPHVDSAQAAGKVPIDLAALPVDLMSSSAHKIDGSKDIGALYVELRPRMRIACQMHGGVHERGMGSGTLCTHQILEELPLPPVEIHCSILAEDAIKAAVSDFRSRQTIRGAAADDL
ncbi:cysteine sulfinate desulfinase/cysteine desulfurase-like protein [Paraburkholderia sp. WC7.3d]